MAKATIRAIALAGRASDRNRPLREASARATVHGRDACSVVVVLCACISAFARLSRGVGESLFDGEAKSPILEPACRACELAPLQRFESRDPSGTHPDGTMDMLLRAAQQSPSSNWCAAERVSGVSHRRARRRARGPPRRRHRGAAVAAEIRARAHPREQRKRRDPRARRRSRARARSNGAGTGAARF